MKKSIGISIIGASGYGAGELLRLLAYHPECEVVSLISNSHVGQNITKLHPHLTGFYDIDCDSNLNLEKLSEYEHQIIFSALPHGVSAQKISDLIESNTLSNLHVIDLSGDFRLTDLKTHSEFYPESPFNAALREHFCYGLPEITPHDKISKAQHISNPGCYATACILSVAPLIGKFSGSVFFDAKSGTSGAGRSLSNTTHHPEMHSNFSAYKILQHRHEPEIQQTIGELLPCSFVPHLIPIVRGIFVTAHLELQESISEETIKQLYADFFRNKQFIRFKETPPQLSHVIGSNFCDISIAVREKRLVAMSTLDNLIKGMAGQAIQNMNLICKLPEETGLHLPPLNLI